MSNTAYYLRPNVQLEPLVNQWYAWPHLIAPATAALNMANSHLKIMKSYTMAPEVHAAAVKNPAMAGGPFIDYQGKRVDEIKALMEKTTREQSQMIALAEALKGLNAMLVKEARGESLEPLYAKVPEALKGYVELVYDLNHNPGFRLLESLLYKSAYYDPSLQSIVLSVIERDERAFAFSTPRLADQGRLHLHIPFNHAGIDELFRMREVPQTFDYIKQRLGVDDKDDELFKTFLTEEAPPKPARYNGDQVRIRYFGHACLLIESRGISVLTDPLVSYQYANPVARYTSADLPEVIDYVLITHGHSDHLLFESLLQLRHKIKNIVVPRSGWGNLEDPSLKLILKNAGFKKVIEIDELESLDLGGGEIVSVPFLGEHADLAIRSKTAHLVRVGGVSVLCAADSSNLEPKLYEHLHQLIGDIDILFLGMECDGAPLTWIYGPLLLKPVDRKADRSRKLSGSDYERAMDMVNRLHCRQVYVYAMGQEPWLGFITSIKYTDESKQIVESNKLLEACTGRGLPCERLFGMKEIIL
jgi:L-ascorbate metabolism protein UlaG (beta-lactamase superfamily)